MELEGKTDAQIGTWIRNHEQQGATSTPLFMRLLEERQRRAQNTHRLNFEKSLAHLMQSAIEQRCTSYGNLASASAVSWSQARHQMNGPNGHLDRLLDICHARGLPLLTAICVNQDSLASGMLGKDALAGFIGGARRLGLPVTDAQSFHESCREACFRWGRDQSSA